MGTHSKQHLVRQAQKGDLGGRHGSVPMYVTSDYGLERKRKALLRPGPKRTSHARRQERVGGKFRYSGENGSTGESESLQLGVHKGTQA